MMKNLQVKLIALTLIAIASTMMFLKVNDLGLPLTPQETTEAWTVEAKVSFDAGGKAAKVKFYIPRTPNGFNVLDEDFVSSNYGLAIDNDGLNRAANWAVRRVKGQQTLYYRIELIADSQQQNIRSLPTPDYPEIPEYQEPERSAILSILETVRRESADTASFTRALLVHLNTADNDENVDLLKDNIEDPVEWARYLGHMLAGARIPSRLVYMLKLRDGVRHASLIPWLEVFDGSNWLAFNPRTGEPGFRPDLVMWRVGDDPLVRVEGGSPAQVDFSIVRQSRAMVAVAERRARQVDSKLMEFSMFGLPVQTQSVYRILLLLPVGALVVVLLRNLIGIKTFGVFMPVLIALSFRETNLLSGVLLYSLLISLGLGMRFYLERLQLLMVPRVAAVVVIVLLTMTALSLLFHKLGLPQGLSIALFPIVIISMTIERMSVVWEEKGAQEAFLQLLGSFVVAGVGYSLMQHRLTMHLMFVFPEISLIILAVIILVGRYTGYRLTELWRFRQVIWSQGAKAGKAK